MNDESMNDFNFDDLDKEIGLGELLKQRENWFVLILKKVIFGLVIAVIGIIVFFASFGIGKILFMADINPTYNSMPQNPPQSVKDLNIPTSTVIIEEKTPEPKKSPKPVITPVVKKSETAPEIKPAPSSAVAKEKSFAVVVGTFSLMSNAEEYSNRLDRQNFETQIKPLFKNGRELYRVICGVFSSVEKAQARKKELAAIGIESFYIVTE